MGGLLRFAVLCYIATGWRSSRLTNHDYQTPPAAQCKIGVGIQSKTALVENNKIGMSIWIPGVSYEKTGMNG
jgi:hypothetical protein